MSLAVHLSPVVTFNPFLRLFLVLAGCFPLLATGAQRPSVLFISIDDLNDWLGCLEGHPQAVTPNLDRLAKRGVLFTEAHCAAPLCKPSRTAVFSGRSPHQTGVYGNGDADIRKRRPELVLLPKAFARAGYQTYGAGKLLHGNSRGLCQDELYPGQRWSPFAKGTVDYTKKELPSKGTDNPRHVIKNGPGGVDYVLPLNRMPSDRAPREKKGESFDWGPFDLPDSAFGDGEITDWAIERVRPKHDKPFFMAVGYYRPHIPLFAPGRDFESYPEASKITLPPYRADDLDDLGPVGKRWAREAVTAGSHKTTLEHEQWQEAVRAYLACVTFVDRQVGRILSELEKSPHAANTWIVVWGDHGWHLGEKQHWGKWTGWRRSTRVPLIVVPPNRETRFARNKKCAEPVSLLDLYPTLLAACGLKAPHELAGTSLLPLLENPALQTKRRVLTSFDRGNYSVSGRSWHYIRYAKGEEELYHRADDPNEWNNLVKTGSHDKILAEMRACLPVNPAPAARSKPKR